MAYESEHFGENIDDEVSRTQDRKVTVGDPGSDDLLVSEAAVRAAIAEIPQTVVSGAAPITATGPVDTPTVGIDDDTPALVPRGGTEGQSLIKVSDLDRDVTWRDQTQEVQDAEANCAASEINAANCAAQALEDANAAEASKDNAYNWAQADVDVPVDDGEHPVGRSSYHWAKAAEGIVAGGITVLTGTAPVNVTHVSETNKDIYLSEEDPRFVPLGGLPGQHLEKVDATDRNLTWADPPDIPDVSDFAAKSVINDFTIQQRFPEVVVGGLPDFYNWNLNLQQAAVGEMIGDTEITPINLQAGGTYILRITQDATGGHALTWGANVKWDENGEPAINPGALKTTIYTFYSDGATMYGQLQWREAA